MRAKLLFTLVLLPVLALAASPVATVSANGPLLLNGTPVPNAGVGSWPVVAGDRIETTTAPALITFPDGARLTIGKNTAVTLPKGSSGAVELLSGEAMYKVGPGAKLDIRALGRPLDLQSRAEGVISVGQGERAVVRPKMRADNDAFSLPKHKYPKPRSLRDKGDNQ